MTIDAAGQPELVAWFVDYCPHGKSDIDLCDPCRMARIESLLERIAEALESTDQTVGRQAALEALKTGQGRHPDD